MICMSDTVTFICHWFLIFSASNVSGGFEKYAQNTIKDRIWGGSMCVCMTNNLLSWCSRVEL